jgi:hypothetical protein
MKIATNKNMSSRLFNRAPINFWEPVAVEQPSTTKNDDSICHEVKYNPTDKTSESYKMYMTAFSHGTPEQWLKFMENLNVVIRGNGLNENGRARFNLTHSSLKGEALRIFNDKAAEQDKETKDTHITCLHTITEQVFPTDNPLQKQKMYMRNHVFLHLNDKQVSEFRTWDTLQKFGNPEIGDKKSAHQARYPSSRINRSLNLVFSDYRQIRIIRTHQNSSESPNLVIRVTRITEQPNIRLFGSRFGPSE